MINAPKRLARAAVAAVLVAAMAPATAAESPTWYEFLNRDVVGAEAFNKAHPQWDGRGVVIAILDTGVDPSVPGLRHVPSTGGSAGQIKLIEARDFSGQGDVELTKARRVVEDGKALLRNDDGFVHGVDALKLAPDDGVWLLGFFTEAQLEHSDVEDVNRNDKQDDRFAVVAFRPKGGGHPVAIIDTDGDADISDEELRRSYRHDQRWFSFSHPDPRKDQTPVAFTLEVMPDGDKKVELHFDDGGHGTHCAGIASGFGIHGRAGFDGIAPGAQVMSLKIGNNNLAGGATTPGSMRKAIDYAAEWAADHDIPVVMNISYGIGSEIEGYSGIDMALDSALEGERLLVASVAAGNDGPGLSTIGTPGASARAWTAGAYLDPRNGEALWGAGLDGPRLFAFSSRGGELGKPDGVSPGVAWSTVPPFMRRAIMAGTSMATPQATGVLALLVSAARQERVPWNAGLLKRALKGTARRLDGYTTLDQGAGLIQVGPAFKALRRIAREAEAGLLAGWDVETDVPHRPGTDGTASYWRTGHYVPTFPHTVDIGVRPVFFADATDADKNTFFAQLELKTDASWLSVDRRKVGVKGESAAWVELSMKDKPLRAPGLHVAHLTVTTRGSKVPIAKVPISVVMPHRFETKDTRRRTFRGFLKPGDYERVFVEVPPAATAMSLTLRTPKGQFGKTYLELYDPEGRPTAVPRARASSKDGSEASTVLSGVDLTPGVWEIVPYASFRNPARSAWELEVAFAGLDLERELPYSVPDGGGLESMVTVTNRFESPIRGAVLATVRGMERAETIDVEGPEYTQIITLGEGTAGATLQLELTAEDYNKFTDVAVNVYDGAGNAVAKSGFGNRKLTLTFGGGPGEYRMEVVGGTADAKTPEDVEWMIELVERHNLAAHVGLGTTGPDGPEVTLYPGIPVDIDLTLDGSLAELPDGFSHAGLLLFHDQGSPGPGFRFPVRFER